VNREQRAQNAAEIVAQLDVATQKLRVAIVHIREAARLVKEDGPDQLPESVALTGLEATVRLVINDITPRAAAWDGYAQVRKNNLDRIPKE
jgi:hypothetical protein